MWTYIYLYVPFSVIVMAAMHINNPDTTYSKISYNSLFAFTLVVFLYTLGRFAFFDLLGIRRPVQLLFMGLVLLLGSIYLWRGLKTAYKNTQAVLLLTVSLFMILKGHNPVVWADGLFSVIIVLIIGGASDSFNNKLITYIINLTLLLSVMSLILFAITVINPAVGEMTIWPENIYLSDSVLINNIFMLLGSATSGPAEFAGITIYRIKSFLYEPSLITAYFGVPCALSLVYKKSILPFLVILSFIIISLSGTSYTFIILAVVSYILMKYCSNRAFSILPFICGVLFWAFVTINIPPLELGNDDFYGEINQFKALAGNDPSLSNFSGDRKFSAIIRLGMLSAGLHGAYASPLIGVSSELNVVLGILLYSFVTAGMVGLLLCVFFVRRLFIDIYHYYSISSSQYRYKVSAALLSGLLLQAFVMNDYGFTTTYGMTIIAVLHRFLIASYTRSNYVAANASYCYVSK